MYIYIYDYTYKERDRERHTHTYTVYITYIHIYIYIYTCVYNHKLRTCQAGRTALPLISDQTHLLTHRCTHAHETDVAVTLLCVSA